VIDGAKSGLLDVPLKLLTRGDFAKVPLIVGNNEDGGSYLDLVFPLAYGAFRANIRHQISWMFPDTADQRRADELYGGRDMPDNRTAISRLTRDWMFACSSRDIATAFANASVPVYQYVFAFNETGLVEKMFGASHGFELPFVWRWGVETLGLLQSQRKRFETMADIMSCTWASFVTCHKPKCDTSPPHCSKVLNEIPDWPLFGSERNYMSLKVTPTVEQIKSVAAYGQDEMPGDDRCDFLKEAIQRSGFRDLTYHPKQTEVIV
jgi:carboxylesterase type B